MVETMEYPFVRTDPLHYRLPLFRSIDSSVIFAVQVSMNLNASLYANAVPLLSDEFQISEQAARVGQAVFLISYAFGCELWAPWSEELGRWPILQLSLFLVNSTILISYSCSSLIDGPLISLANTMRSRTELRHHSCLSLPWWPI
jgi:MFS family permease